MHLQSIPVPGEAKQVFFNSVFFILKREVSLLGIFILHSYQLHFFPNCFSSLFLPNMFFSDPVAALPYLIDLFWIYERSQLLDGVGHYISLFPLLNCKKQKMDLNLYC